MNKKYLMLVCIITFGGTSAIFCQIWNETVPGRLLPLFIGALEGSE